MGFLGCISESNQEHSHKRSNKTLYIDWLILSTAAKPILLWAKVDYAYTWLAKIDFTKTKIKSQQVKAALKLSKQSVRNLIVLETVVGGLGLIGVALG